VQIFPPSNDILYYYINSEILVLSSRYEGMPLVMLEAMSCGVPCVAFDCLCGPRNIISNGKDGLLVRNGDIANLAESVKLLIENPKLRQFMGENAVKKSQRYALTVIMRQWDALFKSLLNK
jgi:glycosyltransferase involved in cell wall biosynthesis